VSRLHRAIAAEIDGIEKGMKTTSELIESQKAAKDYWEMKLVEERAAVAELKELAIHLDHIKWEQVKVA
jgi:hypothetical protein